MGRPLTIAATLAGAERPQPVRASREQRRAGRRRFIGDLYSTLTRTHPCAPCVSECRRCCSPPVPFDGRYLSFPLSDLLAGSQDGLPGGLGFADDAESPFAESLGHLQPQDEFCSDPRTIFHRSGTRKIELIGLQGDVGIEGNRLRSLDAHPFLRNVKTLPQGEPGKSLRTFPRDADAAGIRNAMMPPNIFFGHRNSPVLLIDIQRRML